MIKLIFVHGNIFVYDIEDWSALRKAHRIVGNIIGSTSSIPSLPLKLMPEEALLLVEKELASIWENRNTASELPDPAANLEDSLLEAQQKEYRQLRKRQLLCLIDNIVEKRRSMGDHRSKEEILNDEINKSSTVTKENMIWPIFLKDPIQSLSAISTDLISSQTTTLRLVIFKDLWQRGYYITSGEKFGGHFLVYFGDPVTYHAIFIVKYTANGVPSFTQHHHASTQQQLLAASTKNNGNYLNQTVYHQNVTPKRQNFEQQNFDIFSVRGLQEKALINSEQKKKNEEAKIETNQFIHQNQQSLPNCQSSVLANPWQNLSASSSSVVDYLSQLPTTSLPISLHDFLKYSAETLKKDTVGQHGAVQQHNGEPNLNIGNNGTVNIDALHVGNSSNRTLNSNNNQALSTLSTINTAHLHNNNILKKKKKKKLEREKKPKPKPGN
ncbi:hypothetical protein YQE_09451, partial [Dendroctonus ponderosae]